MATYKRELRREIKRKKLEPEINFLNITAMLDMMTIILVFLLKSMSAQSASLPQSADLGHATRAWHASPKSDLASFWPEPGQDEPDLLEGVEDRRIVFGHFHVSFERMGAYEIELVAPGSVGMPTDGRIERRRVAYDHGASAARVREVAGGAPWGEVIAARIERASMG